MPAHTSDVEAVGDADRGQIEFGEVRNQPRRAGMIVLGSGDQHRIDVDAHDLVTRSSEMASHPTRPAPGVEHP